MAGCDGVDTSLNSSLSINCLRFVAGILGVLWSSFLVVPHYEKMCAYKERPCVKKKKLASHKEPTMAFILTEMVFSIKVCMDFSRVNEV